VAVEPRVVAQRVLVGQGRVALALLGTVGQVVVLAPLGRGVLPELPQWTPK
jgi:hypothetical protein